LHFIEEHFTKRFVLEGCDRLDLSVFLVNLLVRDEFFRVSKLDKVSLMGSKAMQVFYVVMAVVGFVLPMICFGFHFGNSVDGQAWSEFFVAPWLTWATAGFSWDLMITATTLAVWMFAESKRMGMRGIAWNLALVFLVGMSFALPVFLLRRERKIRASTKSADYPSKVSENNC
jgi:hypothetical protein